MRLGAFAVVLLLWSGCSPSKAISGVVQPEPGERLTSIPGPMPAFGPFDTFSDALQAACPLLLSKPHATAGRPTDENFRLRWALSQEYCAWLYYTPDHKYEMSMLATGAIQDDARKRTCGLPTVVDDPRYPPESLGYVFVLHNHPYENVLSDFDIRFIVAMAAEHGVVVETSTGVIPISIVAFYSRSRDLENPTCDGFFQYIPGTGELLRWTHSQGSWSHELMGRVVWLDATTYRIDKR
jgi:hypothetical protein